MATENEAVPTENIKSHKRVLIYLTIFTTVLSWAVSLLFVGDSLFSFLNPLKAFISSLGPASWIVYGLLFIIITCVFFFVGGIGSAFIQMAVILFAPVDPHVPPYGAFFLSATCIFIASLVQYWLGRKIGVKPFKWAIGSKDYDKAIKVTSSPTVIALALLLPYFPDSLICFLAGASKQKFKYFWIIALLTRTVGVAGIAFVNHSLLNLDTWKAVAAIIGWVPTAIIIFSGLMAFLGLIILLFIAGRYIEKKAAERHARKQREAAQGAETVIATKNI